jgi:hypothetical protein
MYIRTQALCSLSMTINFMTTTQERIDCPLSQWSGVTGNCQWCDTTICEPRRRSWCGTRCANAWAKNHVWRYARAAAKRRAKYHCERTGCQSPRLDCEVNHIQPRNGDGYDPGCHHHLDPDTNGEGGLEVLCHAHHAVVTKEQAQARAAARTQADI